MPYKRRRHGTVLYPAGRFAQTTQQETSHAPRETASQKPSSVQAHTVGLR